MADYDCIVMGAGIAGVTAARNLRRIGFRVVLLEASERVGGRMRTNRGFVQSAGFTPADWPLEQGAEFVHVPTTARYVPFYAEMGSHGFECVRFPKYEIAGKGHNRVTFPDWPEVRRLWATIQSDDDISAMTCLLSEVGKIRAKTDQSLGEYLRGRDYKGKGRTMARYALSAHTPGRLDDVIDDISVLGLVSDQIPDQLLVSAEFKISMKGKWCGYDALPNAIADQLTSPKGTGPRGELRLNSPVARVEREGAGKSAVVRVTLEDGTALTGRSAVCTFSVGVLDPVAGMGDSIFGPLLTPSKRDALRVVRMGAITKASLEFKACMWGDRSHMSVLSNPHVGDGQDQVWARTFFSAFPAAERGPFILTALMMGRDHLDMSSRTDAEGWRFLFDVIESIFNRPAPGTPKRSWVPEEVLVGRHENGQFIPNFMRTDWSRVPYILGGNSYIAYDAESPVHPQKARQALMDPRETLPLFWAGEATAPAHDPLWQPLSVHGAFMSGVRVAEQVRAHLRPGAAASSGAGAMSMALVSKKASKKTAKKASKTAAVRPLRGPSRKRVQLSVPLDLDETEILRRYAAEKTGGDEGKAAARLFRTALRVMAG